MICYINRGLPGSGKSTNAKKIRDAAIVSGKTAIIICNDDYHMVDGEYKWSAAKMLFAIEYSQKLLTESIAKQYDVIIIDNTHICVRDMKESIIKAHESGYEIVILESQTSWAWDLEELCIRNIHGVPRETIKRMLDKYEHDVTLEKVLQQCCLK